MCGIAGCYDISHQSSYDELLTNISGMTDALIHRGPDSGGVWVDMQAGVALGSRRLAILDLSDEGAQPMISANGRYVIVFNGEIYNFEALREQLKARGHAFRGHSDTEVMLEAFGEWGIERAVQQFNGMFAFALWDRISRLLWLCRDRAGEKPLYYGWMGDKFIFGSELKALRFHSDFQAEINRDVLPLYLRYGYVPTPHSIYENVLKLPPATLLCVNPERNLESIPYWTAKEVVEQGINKPFVGTEADAIEALDELLRDSIRLRMIADVPIGAFLSGGIDSTTVVALMQAQSSRPIKSFTIGFHERAFDEASYARAVAQHLGTHHTELYLRAQDAIDVIPSLPTIYDEPFADSSQIPTLLVSQLARQEVTVSLSGDGGDELFGGYLRYTKSHALWKKINRVPAPLRKMSAAILDGIDERLGHRVQTATQLLQINEPEELYLREISHWLEPNKALRFVPDQTELRSNLSGPPPGIGFYEQMMYQDLLHYLPDDILVKVDRASMFVSLEARVPLLDYRVIEFAWQIPLAFKVRDGQGKWLLRQVLSRYIPPTLIERPKMGFGLPIGEWLKHPLRDWAEALLDKARLKREGFFQPEAILLKWKEHLSGQRNWEYLLWDVLVFQTWLNKEQQLPSTA